MHFSRIKLRNWKNFKNVEAPLQLRVFIIGPNASGKSNLLDAFRFLRDVALDGLEKAIDGRGGVSTVRCLSATRYSDILIEVDVADPGIADWKYRLVFNQDQQRRATVKSETVWRNSIKILDRPDQQDQRDPPSIGSEEVLRLEPSSDGTVFAPVDEADRQALRAGLTVADVLMPKAAPQNVEQLALEFG